MLSLQLLDMPSLLLPLPPTKTFLTCLEVLSHPSSLILNRSSRCRFNPEWCQSFRSRNSSSRHNSRSMPWLFRCNKLWPSKSSNSSSNKCSSTPRSWCRSLYLRSARRLPILTTSLAASMPFCPTWTQAHKSIAQSARKQVSQPSTIRIQTTYPMHSRWLGPAENLGSGTLTNLALVTWGLTPAVVEVIKTETTTCRSSRTCLRLVWKRSRKVLSRKPALTWHTTPDSYHRRQNSRKGN